MPLLLEDHIDAILDAQATKTITVPILGGEFLKEVERKGVTVPEVELDYIPSALNYDTEDAYATGRNFEGSISLITAVVTKWDLQRKGSDGEPEPWPITRQGLFDLNDRIPQAVVGIAGHILDDYSEKKGSRSGSQQRSSTRRRR